MRRVAHASNPLAGVLGQVQPRGAAVGARIGLTLNRGEFAPGSRRSRIGLRPRMGGVLRPGQSRASDRGGPDLAALPLDVCVRHAGLPGHRGGPPGRRMLLARRVPVRRRRPRPPGRRGQKLTDADWQFREKGLGRKGYLELDEHEGQPQYRTRKHKDACIFLNRPGFCRRCRLRAAQQSPQTGRAAADHEARRLLAAADPAQPGMGDPARRHGNPQDLASPNTTAAAGVPVAPTCTGTAPAIRPPMSAPSRCGRAWPTNSPSCSARRPTRNWRQCASAAALGLIAVHPATRIAE